jgi:protein MAK11
MNVGRFLLIGGFEELIKIYDIRKRREVGLLEGHGGTITVLKHHDNFVFSGSEDSTIKVWKTKDWALMETLQLQDVPR